MNSQRLNRASLKVLVVYTVWLAMGAGFAVANSVPPIPDGKFEHAPYAERACVICHQNNDEKNPGPILAPVNTLCLGCHEEFNNILSKRHAHGPARKRCTFCHNPHNSENERLLVEKPFDLCTGCHSKMADTIQKAPIKHGAINTGDACVNCHDPHASNMDSLLKNTTGDLCINCHSRNDILDYNGKPLTNIKELLEIRKDHIHGPVADKDCTACHFPHASYNFRLLVENYPAKFYSPFDPNQYKLCFSCHEPSMVTERETTTMTGFRDGKKNLHFKHVNRDYGRTCRACHEIHAAEHPHIVRDKVPYGSSGWQLSINYEPLPDGGRCSKTCHGLREYSRSP